jgi:dihydroorotate dehydrogenase (fumarate)
MERLSTNYLGLNLKSPVIAGSSSITSSLSKMKEAEDSGAGAVIMKSLFEEQINYSIATTPGLTEYPESDDYIAFYTRSNAVDEYLGMIESAKKSLNIPVIPSINCISADSWIDFAKKVVSAGADALEVNVFFLPLSKKTTSQEAEALYYLLIERLKRSINIPVSIKIGSHFTNLLHLVDQFYNRGVEGVVMFNRFYEPDIDVDTMQLVPSSVFSSPEDRRYVLRWIALASGMDIKIDISASTGVYSGDDAIRYLLAGADTVQVCSALYKNGVSHIKTINGELLNWMDRKGYRSISEFRGILDYSHIEHPKQFERSQFMKYFSSYH